MHCHTYFCNICVIDKIICALFLKEAGDVLFFAAARDCIL